MTGSPTSRTPVRPLAQHKAAALGTSAAVAASNPSIAFAGARVLAEGGNAIDATLAMAAVGWMVLPGQCGVGGDAFAVVREPDGRVWTVGGSGYGPDGGDPAFYRGLGHTGIPMGGALSVSVPGALAALQTLHARASWSLADLWAPAIELGRRGFACTAKTRGDLQEHEAALAADPGTREAFLPGGRLPRVGQPIHQRDLADVVAALAEDPGDFYTGDLADRAVRALQAAGAPFSGAEWRATADAPAQPALSLPYRDGVIHQTPMPTPGWMVLQQAGICDGIVAGHEQLGVQAVHWLAEAARRSFRDRFASCASDNGAWRDTLTETALARARADIAGVGATPQGVRIGGDTTSTVCVDAEGRAVSFIHSLAFTFGARLTVPGTGVVLNNRLGRGAYLIPGHPNEVAPRRKPLHTLNAWVVDHPARGLLHVGNCPGGDGQVQWNMQVISHLLDHGNDPQEAVSLPRFTVFPGADSNVLGQPEQLRCEPGLSGETLDGLRALGHNVTPVPAQVGGPGGSALVISLDHTDGVVRAGADPRMEGTALAL